MDWEETLALFHISDKEFVNIFDKELTKDKIDKELLQPMNKKTTQFKMGKSYE